MNATDTMRTRQKAKILEISDAPVSNSQLSCLYFACGKFLEQRGVRQRLSKVPRGEISQTGFTTSSDENRKLASILNPVICRQDCKLRMSSPTRYFNHSLPYPMLVKPRKSCYSLFLRLKSYPEISSPTENYEQTPQIR